jgi:hypothetical protein
LVSPLRFSINHPLLPDAAALLGKVRSKGPFFSVDSVADKAAVLLKDPYDIPLVLKGRNGGFPSGRYLSISVPGRDREDDPRQPVVSRNDCPGMGRTAPAP